MASSSCPELFFERYDLVQRLGSGSFSEVISCRYKMSGKLFACKQLAKKFQSWEDVKMIAEVKTLLTLPQHQNVIRMIELHFDPEIGQVSMVVDLMDTDLCDLIKSRGRDSPFLTSEIKSMIRQILYGLNHIHKNRLVHRDVKPENILVKYQTKGSHLLALGDFGSVLGTNSTPPFTQYVTTRWYRSPECILSVGYYGSKMDIWATGCIFYEMMTSKPLFKGGNEKEQISLIHDILGPPPTHVLNDFQKWLPKKNKKDTDENQKRRSNIEEMLTGRVKHAVSPYAKSLNELMKDTNLVTRNFLKRMLEFDPDRRATAAALLDHDYFNTPSMTYGMKPVTSTLKRASAEPKSSAAVNPNSLPPFRTPNEGSASGICILTRVDDLNCDGAHSQDPPKSKILVSAMKSSKKTVGTPRSESSTQISSAHVQNDSIPSIVITSSSRPQTPNLLKLKNKKRAQTPGGAMLTNRIPLYFSDDDDDEMESAKSNHALTPITAPPGENPVDQLSVDLNDNPNIHKEEDNIESENEKTKGSKFSYFDDTVVDSNEKSKSNSARNEPSHCKSNFDENRLQGKCGDGNIQNKKRKQTPGGAMLRNRKPLYFSDDDEMESGKSNHALTPITAPPGENPVDQLSVDLNDNPNIHKEEDNIESENEKTKGSKFVFFDDTVVDSNEKSKSNSARNEPSHCNSIFDENRLQGKCGDSNIQNKKRAQTPGGEMFKNRKALYFSDDDDDKMEFMKSNHALTPTTAPPAENSVDQLSVELMNNLNNHKKEINEVSVNKEGSRFAFFDDTIADSNENSSSNSAHIEPQHFMSNFEENRLQGKCGDGKIATPTKTPSRVYFDDTENETPFKETP